jgi:hypothetical protein
LLEFFGTIVRVLSYSSSGSNKSFMQSGRL